MATDTATPSDPVLRLQGLRKGYVEGGRRHEILLDATATVRRGEFVVLLGPSGSGKSTLLNLVSGIDLPDAGMVQVAGTDLTTLSERERTLFRRRHLGFVFQFFNLLPTLTVLENLLLPLELKGRVGAAGTARARELLERVGLGSREDTFPDRLSGGEQQRVALARALVHEPDLILADEPTGNLDPDTGARMLDLLDGLVREGGRTLLAVTHAREVAARADRVLVLDHGRLREDARS
ncbi:MAG: ABC transporter ATP-binding protein [Longimicrobiales bacterium]|nr:ABC transporter ATP-binding protein [Longimicrobiales bacterium]